MGRAALACACLLAAACARREPLPLLGEVPAFQLTAETGEPFDSRSLAGHTWVADFIFTNCPGPCPMMTAHFERIQKKTAGTPVRLVSFTVDPARDTPEALAAFARRFKAEPARWHFLTGDRARLHELGLNAFHLNSVDGSLQHSTRFALVDGRGRIRGYYLTSESGFLDALLADIRRLEHET
jgi:protein SCO1/2